MSTASTIPYRPSQSVRVVYEPNGTPLFCGRDVAEVLGYKAPIKAVERAEGVTLYRRRVSWRSAKAAGSAPKCSASIGVGARSWPSSGRKGAGTPPGGS